MSTMFDSHPARDDKALRRVLEDAAMGRWEGPREMLIATGPDWDRRIFRLQVLAEAGARLRFADTWAEAEPHSPHALALLAHVQALRAMIAGRDSGQTQMEEAWATCRAALDLWPQDVAPLVVMLALLRTHAPDHSTLSHVWEEMKQPTPGTERPTTRSSPTSSPATTAPRARRCGGPRSKSPSPPRACPSRCCPWW
ncbi:hypothetical protein GCM10018785_12080 [Streptomyces longispororuber]|uniref:Uncharacterized protein n=1 Tax=Streptomyces longispororuber TaxID=68230 RepID=A0A919DGX4_9ACTN|nr:hypothetical protein GCM10018785_12080 [Streptomyces longispororuber]